MLSNFAPSTAKSLPSTFPDTVMFPVTPTPPDCISSLVLPPVCTFKVPSPVSLIIESVVLWNISKSCPVPNLAFALSTYVLSPLKLLPVVRAKLPVCVTPETQAEPS